MRENWDTIIIGGGASGLASAHRLADAGQYVLLVEARDRFGGRILTLPGRDLPLELGAEFIHGCPDTTDKWLLAAGITRYRVDENQWVWRGNRLVRTTGLKRRLAKSLQTIRVGKRDGSVAACLEETNPTMRAMTLHYISGFNAGPADDISAKVIRASATGVVEEENATFRPARGYQNLVDHMVATLGPTVTALNNCPADKVVWKKGQVRVRFRRGKRVAFARARRVIVTVPIGVLKAPAGAKAALAFDPPLREKETVLDLIGMGKVTRLLLWFASEFWRKHLRRFGFMHFPEGHFETWWTAAPLPHPLLTAWAGAGKSEALGGLDERGLRDRAIEDLARLLKVSPREISKNLRATYFHDWNADPYSRGAYSYPRPGGEKAPRRLAEPVENTIFFAGEAAQFGGQSGTVEGALASAEWTGKKILKGVCL